MHYSKLIFVNNFFYEGTMDQMWSVACEFQFYLVSPFIVMHMASSERPWLIPVLLTSISLVLNYVIVYNTCPEFMTTMAWEATC